MKKIYSIIFSIFMLILIISVFPYTYMTSTTKSIYNSTNSTCIGNCDRVIHPLDVLYTTIAFSLMIILLIIFIIVKIKEKNNNERNL